MFILSDVHLNLKLQEYYVKDISSCFFLSFKISAEAVKCVR